MAVIRPSPQFDGSELGQEQLGKIIKSEVRTVSFQKQQHKDGVYLYFLPAYKVDSFKRGVWYNPLTVRDNFGDKFKDRYVVWDPENDPVAYFEANIKQLFPEHAEVKEKIVNGRKQKDWPCYGRLTRRVLYNVAYKDHLELGSHVLELPQANGASQLDAWQKSLDANGKRRGVISDPDHCVPVFMQLSGMSGESPWKIMPSPEAAVTLPEGLVDQDALYNLDNVFIRRTADELMAKLRSMVHPDIYKQCMEGFRGGSTRPTINIPELITPAVQTPKVKTVSSVPMPTTDTAPAKLPAPVPAAANLPPISIPKAVIYDDAPTVDGSSSTADEPEIVDREKAMAFLQSQVNKKK